MTNEKFEKLKDQIEASINRTESLQFIHTQETGRRHVPGRIAPEADETVTICKEEYDDLISDEKLLRALIDAGVDNWEGYEEAQNMMEE